MGKLHTDGEAVSDRESPTTNFRCPGCHKPGQEMHPCPYDLDATEKHEPTCTCCDECTDKCDGGPCE